MKYMGSKAAIADEILSVIFKHVIYTGQYWVEPFVGGGNMISRISIPSIGGDNSLFVIAALTLIQDNPESIPEIITEAMYYEAWQRIKDKEYSQLQLDSWIGFSMSYGAKWWGGYSRGKNRRGQQRNYALEGRRNALKQSLSLQKTFFTCDNYYDLDIPDCSIIYCDPPYKNTTEYKTDYFDTYKFWQWCREKAKEKHQIFISEYEAPDDFECIWLKEKVSSLTKNTGGKKGMEKLFRLREGKKEMEKLLRLRRNRCQK